MKLDEILKRLDLKLGMKILDTKPSRIIKSKDYVYTLVKERFDVIIFRNSDGWGINVFYVLEHMNTKHSRFQPYKEKEENILDAN